MNTIVLTFSYVETISAVARVGINVMSVLVGLFALYMLWWRWRRGPASGSSDVGLWDEMSMGGAVVVALCFGAFCGLVTWGLMEVLLYGW